MFYNCKFIIYEIKAILLILSFVLISNAFNTNYETEYFYDTHENFIIEIPKINLRKHFLTKDIKEPVVGIVVFSNYGRPNIKNSNTIIGAHSGSGINAYFNDLNELEINDIVYLYYYNELYKYIIVNKYEIIETDLQPLNNVYYKSTLTLLTCKKNNNKYRLVLVGELVY